MRCRFELVRFQRSGVDLATMVTVRAARGSADTGVICVVCRELGVWPANTRPIRHTDKRSRFITHFRLGPPTVLAELSSRRESFKRTCCLLLTAGAVVTSRTASARSRAKREVK